MKNFITNQKDKKMNVAWMMNGRLFSEIFLIQNWSSFLSHILRSLTPLWTIVVGTTHLTSARNNLWLYFAIKAKFEDETFVCIAIFPKCLSRPFIWMSVFTESATTLSFYLSNWSTVIIIFLISEGITEYLDKTNVEFRFF